MNQQIASDHYGLHMQRYAHVSRLMLQAEWELHYEAIWAIERLKRETGAVVLAHNYQRPEIFHAVADFRGDSLALARMAAQSRAPLIVMCGVRFMAETTKLLAPESVVLLPDAQAGCSLADSISASDVLKLRARYPGVPAVCYVNTSAAVKAECDVCCTSANAVEVVRRLEAPEVILVPDEYLAAHVAARTGVYIVSWNGSCEVHERFSGSEVAEYRRATQAYVLAHPECSMEVQAEADYVGSTAGMAAVLVTECSMSDNICSAFTRTQFIRPCNLCPNMQRITLENIRACLEKRAPAIDIPADVAARARSAVTRMFTLCQGGIS